jgi:hypothetical protein
LASKLASTARSVDDFIIDRLLQPVMDLAAWHLGLPLYTVARVCAVLGAGAGLIWVHDFDTPLSANFFQDLLCLGIMAVTSLMQIRTHESHTPRRAALAPAVRLTGLLWRTLWLLDLALLPTQWPVEGHGELAGDFIWTALLVLPYWIICCRIPPPPERRFTGVFQPVTIPVR